MGKEDEVECEDEEKGLNAVSTTDAARLRRLELLLLVETKAGVGEVDDCESRGGFEFFD